MVDIDMWCYMETGVFLIRLQGFHFVPHIHCAAYMRDGTSVEELDTDTGPSAFSLQYVLTRGFLV